jgi:cohesin complex subunit SA-1/2
VANDITRALIKSLPRLFIKHRTDTKRIAEVLSLPMMMNLDLYLEMRMITVSKTFVVWGNYLFTSWQSYAGLWDDVTKQFFSHFSLTVLAQAASAIRYFTSATSLSNTNATKIAELEEELSSTLHDAVAGREEIEVATFSEDEVITLGAICSRIAVLFGTRDMTAWIEEDEGGKQSSAWDIVSALSERGRLGYKEEELVSFFFCNFRGFGFMSIFSFFVDGRAGLAGIDATYYVEGERAYWN